MADVEASENNNENDNVEDLEREPDVYYKPVVVLPEVKIITHEEGEEELIRLRCKLYRYAYDSDDVEWKERGIGDIKILKHPDSGRIRVVMRREKVFTVCCNHYLKAAMQLSRASGTTSDRAVVWSTLSDFADGDTPKRETFAARFQSAEIADSFRDKWNEIMETLSKIQDVIISQTAPTESTEKKNGVAKEKGSEDAAAATSSKVIEDEMEKLKIKSTKTTAEPPSNNDKQSGSNSSSSAVGGSDKK